MFSCFGNKSSSKESISTRRNSSVLQKTAGVGRSMSVTQGKREVTKIARTSSYRTVVESFITHSSSGVFRKSSSTSSSSLPKTDAIPFKQPNPERKLEIQKNVFTKSSSTPSSSFLKTDALPFMQPNSERKLDFTRSPEPSTSRKNSVQNPVINNVPPTRTSIDNVIKYTVKKTNRRYDNDVNDRRPVYQTHSKKRGKVLIINNVKFCNRGLQRRGAEKDEKDLINVFKQIGFQVKNHRNVKKSETKKILKNFTSQKNLQEADICLVVFMSHGTNNNTPGGYTEILCADSEKIPTEEIIDYFNESRCTLLKNKPKIFIFQCCRNSNERDGLPPTRKPQDKSNTLIAYSTIPGFPSNRNPQKGTWYIQTICKVFSEHAHEYHIEDLLKMVDTEMKSLDPELEQVSCYENRGFARCFLHPIDT